MHYDVHNIQKKRNNNKTKLGIEGNFLKLIKDSYKNLTAIIYKIRNKVRMSTLTTSIQHCIGRSNSVH